MLALGAWLAGGLTGVLGGGSYWPHYLIELVGPAAVGAGVALAGLRLPGRRALAVGLVGAAVLVAVQAPGSRPTRPERATLAVGRWIRHHAGPGDTQYVLYARANVGFYDGLPSPYPYAWSLMVRARPGAVPRLRALLASSRRPTWVVRWQDPAAWGLDPHHRLARVLATRYRPVATVDGRAILHRLDGPRAA